MIDVKHAWLLVDWKGGSYIELKRSDLKEGFNAVSVTCGHDWDGSSFLNWKEKTSRKASMQSEWPYQQHHIAKKSLLDLFFHTTF